VHVALLIQHAMPMLHIVTAFVAPRSPLNFSAVSHNGAIYGKKVLNTKCVFSFSLHVLSKIFFI
jgi:hypothetical protein